MRYNPERLMRIGFVVVVAILLFMTAVAFQATARLTELSGWVSHTQEVRAELARTLCGVTEAEAAQRLYLLLGRKRDLDDYQEVCVRIAAHVDHVADLTSDNPRQQNRIAKLRVDIRQALDDLERAISLRQPKTSLPPLGR